MLSGLPIRIPVGRIIYLLFKSALYGLRFAPNETIAFIAGAIRILGIGVIVYSTLFLLAVVFHGIDALKDKLRIRSLVNEGKLVRRYELPGKCPFCFGPLEDNQIQECPYCGNPSFSIEWELRDKS